MKLLLATIVFFAGNWVLDIGHVVYFQGNGWLTNGLWTFPALIAYHFGWYASIAAFMYLALNYYRLEKSQIAKN